MRKLRDTIYANITNNLRMHLKRKCWLADVTIIESLDSISRDDRDSPWTQYVINIGISHGRYTITHFKHHYRVLQLISN